MLAGAVLYLASFAITAAHHVPRNDSLATVDPHGAEAAAAWQAYAAEWTRMNHLRSRRGASPPGWRSCSR